MKVGHFIWSSCLLMMMNSCDIMISCFVHPRNMMSRNLQPLSRNAPIVIADECIRLSQKLKEVRHNNAGILLFDYRIDSKQSNMSVNTMKRIYQHSKAIADKQSYIQERQIYRILNFSYDREKYMKVERRYNEDVQHVNILRAFVTGMYLDSQTTTTTTATVNDTNVFRSWNNLEKVNRIIENKYNLPRSTQYPQDIFFFSLNNNKMIYKQYMRRNDTMYKECFDTSRHLLLFEDLYVEKHIPYIAKVNNPIGIKITGKVHLKKILSYLTQNFKSRNEIILVISFHRLISMRRLVPRLIKALQAQNLLYHNINLCFEVNSYQEHKGKFTSNDTDKDIDFIYKMQNKYNISNSGFYFRFAVTNDDITMSRTR